MGKTEWLLGVIFLRERGALCCCWNKANGTVGCAASALDGANRIVEPLDLRFGVVFGIGERGFSCSEEVNRLGRLYGGMAAFFLEHA